MKAGRSGMSITLPLGKFDDSKKYHSAPLRAKIRWLFLMSFSAVLANFYSSITPNQTFSSV